MNLNERFYLVAKNAKGKRTKILGQYDSVDVAQLVADGHPESALPDFDILRGDQLAEKLSGPDIVALHNAIVPKAEAVERFSDRATGITRLLRAHAANGSQALPGDFATKTVAVPAQNGETSPVVPTTGAEGKEAAEAANTNDDAIWPDAPAEERKMKPKKTRAPRATAVAAEDKRKLVLSPKGKDKNAEKVWHEGSARSKAFEWLKEKVPLAYQEAIRGIAAAQRIAQPKARGLLSKLMADKMIEVTE